MGSTRKGTRGQWGQEHGDGRKKDTGTMGSEGKGTRGQQEKGYGANGVRAVGPLVLGLTSLGLIQLEVEILPQLALVGPAHRFLFSPFFRQLRPLGRALGRFGFASGFRRTFWGQGLSTTGSAPTPKAPFWGLFYLHPEAPAPPPPAPACPAAPSPSAPRRRRARGRKVWQSCFRLPASPRKDWAENGAKKGDLGFCSPSRRSLGLYPAPKSPYFGCRGG